jgi:acyl-CoA synthetase (AMP-forming)/AMP-acid ligase II
VPDAHFGQVVAVAVESSGDPDDVRAAVRDLARRELSPFKRPRWVAVAPRLVLGRTGKIDRAATAVELATALVRV